MTSVMQHSTLLNKLISEKSEFSEHIVNNSIDFSEGALAALKIAFIQRKFYDLVEKYSTGETPVILEIKDGFVQKIANKLAENPNEALIVAIAGESACGKGYIQTAIIDAFNEHKHLINKNLKIANLKGDNFYHDLSAKITAEYGNLDNLLATDFGLLDRPEAVNLEELSRVLSLCTNCQEVKIPHYQFGTAKSIPDAITIEPSRLVLLDSIFALNEKLLDFVDIGVYIDASSETIKQRWFQRAPERNIFGEMARQQFEAVKEEAQKHIIPTSKNAHIILNGESTYEAIYEFTTDIIKAIS